MFQKPQMQPKHSLHHRRAAAAFTRPGHVSKYALGECWLRYTLLSSLLFLLFTFPISLPLPPLSSAANISFGAGSSFCLASIIHSFLHHYGIFHFSIGEGCRRTDISFILRLRLYIYIFSRITAYYDGIGDISTTQQQISRSTWCGTLSLRARSAIRAFSVATPSYSHCLYHLHPSESLHSSPAFHFTTVHHALPHQHPFCPSGTTHHHLCIPNG